MKIMGPVWLLLGATGGTGAARLIACRAMRKKRRSKTVFTEVSPARDATRRSNPYPHSAETSRRWIAPPATPAPPRPGAERACRRRRARLSELPRRRACHSLLEQSAVFDLSGEPAAHVRRLPWERAARQAGGLAGSVFALHGFDSRIRAHEGRAAGGRELLQLPRIARHPDQ